MAGARYLFKWKENHLLEEPDYEPKRRNKRAYVAARHSGASVPPLHARRLLGNPSGHLAVQRALGAMAAGGHFRDGSVHGRLRRALSLRVA